MPRCLLVLVLAGCVRDEFTIELADENNFSFSSLIEASSQPVPSGEDCPVDWSELTADLLGDPVEPTSDVDEVRMIRFGSLTEEEVLTGINEDELDQSDITGFASYFPEEGEVDAMITDFALLGTEVDPAEEVVEGKGTYLLTALTGATYRMFTFFVPTEGAEPTTIILDESVSALEYTVDLDAGDSIRSRRATRLVVDWRGLTTGGNGKALELGNIDGLLVAAYSQSIEELESDFLHVDQVADLLFEADVNGLGDFDLSEMTTDDGTRFDGFEKDYTWLIALQCNSCVNPTPLFLGVVE